MKTNARLVVLVCAKQENNVSIFMVATDVIVTKATLDKVKIFDFRSKLSFSCKNRIESKYEMNDFESKNVRFWIQLALFNKI